jgi:hypothetical protein
MAKRTQLFDLFSPPPVTKEDAAEPRYGTYTPDVAFNSGHPHDGFYPDGYDAGSELPDDIYIDRLVYPHAESEQEEEAREAKAGRDAKIQQFKEDQRWRNRQFRLTDEMVVGKGGPPTMFDERADTAEEKTEEQAFLKKED